MPEGYVCNHPYYVIHHPCSPCSLTCWPQDRRVKKFFSLRAYLSWRLEIEKQAGYNTSKWQLMLDGERQKVPAYVGHEENILLLPPPPQEECVDTEDPPISMPHKLSESDENDSENPMQALEDNPSDLDRNAEDGYSFNPNSTLHRLFLNSRTPRERES
jgi:hypothetical protein